MHVIRGTNRDAFSNSLRATDGKVQNEATAKFRKGEQLLVFIVNFRTNFLIRQVNPEPNRINLSFSFLQSILLLTPKKDSHPRIDNPAFKDPGRLYNGIVLHQ